MLIQLLLIDDDDDDVLIFSRALSELAPEVDMRHFQNGQAALQQLADHKVPPPDIIFLDVNMPVMSGWECLRAIKQIAGLNEIPLIMYSSGNLTLQGIQPADVGAAAFYQKSHDFGELKKTLGEVLSVYVADKIC